MALRRVGSGQSEIEAQRTLRVTRIASFRRWRRNLLSRRDGAIPLSSLVRAPLPPEAVEGR